MGDISYQIYLCNAKGMRLMLFNEKNIISLKLARSLNAVGVLEIELPATFDFSIIQPDAMIEMYRTALGGSTELVTETRWLTVAFTRQLINGVKSYKLTTLSGMDLLTRAHVLYAAGNATYTSLNAAADDEMKTVVAQNLGSAVLDATRKSYNPPLTVQANATAGAVVAKDFAKQNLFTLCQSLADASATAGKLLYFDVVWNSNANSFEFRTYLNQRGSDLSSGNAMVQFSPYRENIRDVSVEYDYRTDINYVYVAGQDIGANRSVQVRYDATRIGVSPYGKRETFQDARQVVKGSTNEVASLQAEGDAILRSNRPRKTFSGTMVNLPTSEFGTHWHWGDRVLASWDADTFIVMINSLTIDLSGGKETISGTLRSVT
jgi:hypothetical protein